MTADVIYLAALKAVLADGPAAARRVLALAGDPAGLAAAVQEPAAESTADGLPSPVRENTVVGTDKLGRQYKTVDGVRVPVGGEAGSGGGSVADRVAAHLTATGTRPGAATVHAVRAALGGADPADAVGAALAALHAAGWRPGDTPAPPAPPAAPPAAPTTPAERAAFGRDMAHDIVSELKAIRADLTGGRADLADVRWRVRGVFATAALQLDELYGADHPDLEQKARTRLRAARAEVELILDDAARDGPGSVGPAHSRWADVRDYVRQLAVVNRRAFPGPAAESRAAVTAADHDPADPAA